MRALLFVLLLLTFVLWIWGLRRASTLFTLRVKQGRITRSSGKIPARLLSEIADILERAGVTTAKIRGVVRDGRPVLLFDGEMSPGTAQQMRNVMGQFSVAEIRNVPRGHR
jgi:hypothetical protein